GVAATERGSGIVQDSYLVTALSLKSEKLTVAVGDDREDGPGDRHTWGPIVSGFFPSLAVERDWIGLEIAEGLAGGFGDEGGAHQVDSITCCLFGGVVGTRTPPDGFTQVRVVREDWQGSAWVVEAWVLVLRGNGHGSAI